MALKPSLDGAVTVRGKAPVDSGLVARTLENAELVVVATPGYLLSLHARHVSHRARTFIDFMTLGSAS